MRMPSTRARTSTAEIWYVISTGCSTEVESQRWCSRRARARLSGSSRRRPPRLAHAQCSQPAGSAPFWIVHGGRGWPHPHGFHPELAQTVAPRGLGMRLQEQFSLDAAAIDAKRNAIVAHRSQTRVMGGKMQAYSRRERALLANARAAAKHLHPRRILCENSDESLM